MEKAICVKCKKEEQDLSKGFCFNCMRCWDCLEDKCIEWKTKEEIEEMIIEFEKALDKYFPKGKTKMRGEALVLFAYAMRIIEKLRKS